MGAILWSHLKPMEHNWVEISDKRKYSFQVCMHSKWNHSFWQRDKKRLSGRSVQCLCYGNYVGFVLLHDRRSNDKKYISHISLYFLWDFQNKNMWASELCKLQVSMVKHTQGISNLVIHVALDVQSSFDTCTKILHF